MAQIWRLTRLHLFGGSDVASVPAETLLKFSISWSVMVMVYFFLGKSSTSDDGARPASRSPQHRNNAAFCVLLCATACCMHAPITDADAANALDMVCTNEPIDLRSGIDKIS